MLKRFLVYGVVYVWTCSVNGKRYVGQTTCKDPHKYCFSHIKEALKGSNRLFHRAIRKYGTGSFSYEIVFWAFNKNSLDYAERLLIETHNSLAPSGYNAKEGGSNGKHLFETRLRMSTLQRQQWQVPTVRTARLAATMDPVNIKNRKQASHTETANLKRSNTCKIKLNDPVVRSVLSEKSRARWDRAGEREKQSARLLVAFANPVTYAAKCLVMKAVSERVHIKKAFIDRMRSSRWVTNGETNRRIQASEQPPQGWHYGRTV